MDYGKGSTMPRIPKIETATFYMLFSRIGLSDFFLFFWRLRFVRSILNAPRRLLWKGIQEFFLRKTSREEVLRIAQSLSKNGYAISHIDNFEDMPQISALQEEYEELLAIEQNRPHSRKSKNFIERLIDDDYDFKSRHHKPLYLFVSNKSLQAIAASYLRLFPKRTSFKVWRSHFTGATERSASQNWHRDYNEFQMVRIFLYFNDVSLNSGAGQYVVGSHYLGDSYHLLEYSEENGTYATDEEIALNFELDRIVVSEGKPGTIVFLDTAGLHRGGFHSVPSERRVALLTYSTAADIMPTLIRL